MAKTATRKTTTQKAVDETQTALVAAEAQLSTYRSEIHKAKKNEKDLRAQLLKGDESISSSAITAAAAEVERLSLLESSAAAAVRSAKKAANLAQTDTYTEVVASILGERLGGRISVEHLTAGAKVPAVKDRALFVQTDARREGAFDSAAGTATITITITSASAGLDEDLLQHLPSFGRSTHKHLVNATGKAGSIVSVAYGQRSSSSKDGIYLHSVSTTAVVAMAVPTLSTLPAPYRWHHLSQTLTGHLKAKRNGWGQSRAVNPWPIEDSSAKVDLDEATGHATITYSAKLPVQLEHSEDKGWSERTVRSRLAEYEGQHVAGIGRVAEVETSEPTVKGVTNNGMSTGRLVAFFPITIAFVARIEQDEEGDR